MKMLEKCIVCGEWVNERACCIEYESYMPTRILMRKGRIHSNCLRGLEKALKKREEKV